MNQYAHLLRLSNPLREPVIRAASQALGLPPGSRGIDAGCGVGLQAILLAEAVGPSGHVTCVDAADCFLKEAERYSGQAGLAERLSFRAGDWTYLPFKDGAFDWLWSADAAGYAAHEPLRELRELARVVKPGGTVALLVYSSQMLLPGYPLLEARLNATSAGIAPFTQAMPPDWHCLRKLGRLRAAGLTDTGVHTLVHQAAAPLDSATRDALVALFEMRWGGAEPEVSAADWAAFRNLCSPEGPDFILSCPDYYAFFTYSLFWGRVAG